MQIIVGIITISDRASAGEYVDLGGPALKEVAEKSGWQVLCGSDCAGRFVSHSGNDPLVCRPGLRFDSRHWWHGHRAARCHAGSNSRHHAGGVAGLRRSDARRVDEDHTKFNSLAQPRGDCRWSAGHRVAGQTERRGGVPRFCGGRNSARCRARARSTSDRQSDFFCRETVSMGPYSVHSGGQFHRTGNDESVPMPALT